jgi:hypothetical protein
MYLIDIRPDHLWDMEIGLELTRRSAVDLLRLASALCPGH